MKTILVINNALVMKRWAIISFLSWKNYAKPEDKFIVLECYDKYNPSCVDSIDLPKLGVNSKNWYEVLSEQQMKKYGKMKKVLGFSGLNQPAAFWDYIEKNIADDEYIELSEPDVLFAKPFEYKSNTKIIADSSYENWHMFLLTKNSEIFDKKIIPGAYAPIYGLAKDFKKLLPFWIENSLSISTNPNLLKNLAPIHKNWWCSMFGFAKTISDLEIEYSFLEINKVPGFQIGKVLRGYHWSVTMGKNYSKHTIDHIASGGEIKYDHYDEDIYFHENLKLILKDEEIFKNNDFSKVINDPQFIGVSTKKRDFSGH